MKIENIKKHAEYALMTYAALPVSLAAIWIGLWGAYLGCETALRAGVEALMNQSPRYERSATLLKKGTAILANTKAELNYADFKTQEGKRIQVYDSQRVLEGKILANSLRMDKMEISKKYDLKIIGSEMTGYTLLEYQKNVPHF